MATLIDQPAATVSFPIVKAEETPEGDLLVYGKATDGSVDSDEQIVDPDWSGKALETWLASGGNVRVQHNPHRDPAGVGVEVEVGKDGAHWVKSLVVEPVAKELVRKGVLRAYSVGIMRPQIVHDVQARGGRIVGGEIGELSLVDRPANRNCGVTLVKAASDGTPEWVGTMFGAGETVTKSATVELPEDLRLPLTAGDLARIEQYHKERVRTSFNPADMAQLVNSGGAAIVKGNVDPDVGGGVDRDKIPTADFAGRDRSFPIVTPGDVSDAAQSIGRAGEDNYSPDELKERIIAIARRKGPEFEAELPESWRKPAKKTAKPDEDEPDTPDLDDDGDEPDGDEAGMTPDDDAEDDGEKKKAAKKAGRVACPECGKRMKAKARFCPTCGTAMKATKGASPKAKDKKTKPVPAHREPDGPQTWDKGAALHDVLCPAYRLADARTAHGLKTLRAAVHDDWSDAGLRDLAAGLRGLDEQTAKAARRVLRKSFTDMYPNVRVTPATMTPGRFNRPYLAAGHPAASAAAAGSQPHAGVGFGEVNAGQFGRGPLTAAHERPSPASGKGAGGYASATTAQAANAMRALHDHVAVTRPELCPLAHTPQPAAVPARKAARKLRKQAKTIKRLEKRLGELASQPDPTAAPVRGILTKNASGGAGPVERRSLVDEANAREQDEYVRYLKTVAASGDPVQREQARAVLTKMQHSLMEVCG